MNTLEFERQKMVRHQLEQQGITDQRVLAAMARIPRHQFLQPDNWDQAYAPRAVPIGGGQTISQPYIVALMTSLLDLEGSETVLEIGTGSGYQAAVLALLTRRVVTIERIPWLAGRAHRQLQTCFDHAPEVIVADGSDAAAVAGGTFDAIVVTAAAPALPEALLERLADPGILVCPVGDRDLQVLHVVRRRDGEDVHETSCPCRFVPLVGRGGWGD